MACHESIHRGDEGWCERGVPHGWRANDGQDEAWASTGRVEVVGDELDSQDLGIRRRKWRPGLLREGKFTGWFWVLAALQHSGGLYSALIARESKPELEKVRTFYFHVTL
ncbi:hypothetical protein E2562_005235 [Oryza meyeriana var. granulata]|uniref:Uncharacterized protein n=1 Tax=Oryza meyeriana var. granulata TaxID=110450 RepID=A0A6G1EF14_9ORYZ|nr:hypothetical protein E2562_005235 [Oryza meyeriana var. granulata]